MRHTFQIEPSTRNEPFSDNKFRKVQDFRSGNQSNHTSAQPREPLTEAWACNGIHTNDFSSHDISNCGINSRNTHSRIAIEEDRGHMQRKNSREIISYRHDRRFTSATEQSVDNCTYEFEIFSAKKCSDWPQNLLFRVKALADPARQLFLTIYQIATNIWRH